jgi:hypothetical protein
MHQGNENLISAVAFIKNRVSHQAQSVRPLYQRDAHGRRVRRPISSLKLYSVAHDQEFMSEKTASFWAKRMTTHRE